MTLLKEIDYGTPARHNEQEVEVTIDGVAVKVPAGTSVLRAATMARAAMLRATSRSLTQSCAPASARYSQSLAPTAPDRHPQALCDRLA